MPNKDGSREQQERAKQRNKDDDMKRGQQTGSKGASGQQRAEDDDRRQGGQRGGSGNFANDPERASEAGRKGGQA